MQKISFGNVIKVNTPLSTAKQIASIANSKTKPQNKTEQQIKSIINDTQEGEAVVFSFSKNGEDTYIFSGKDARKFKEDKNCIYDEMDRIHKYYGNDDDLIDIEVKGLGEEFLSNIKKIILSKGKIPEISAQINPNTDTISSIDIIAWHRQPKNREKISSFSLQNYIIQSIFEKKFALAW